MAVNGGYNHVVERNKALITLYDKFNIKNCLLYHDIKFDNYSFDTSAMVNSKWYENNKNKVKEVETALKDFYTTLQREN
ncbi:hypothetical protein A9G28_06745 [Gilliamella sp. Fer1-1]|nr:hypothetical protein [Gilliamella apicola]OCG41086.1 hypothetical protein A9G28_06745 [Gilliamella apicola]